MRRSRVRVAMGIAPERLFGFVRERPGIGALVMVAYPVFSVMPQGTFLYSGAIR